MSLIPEILRNRVFIEDSGEILVDLDSKVENGEPTKSPPADVDSSALANFHHISLSNNEPQPFTVDPPASISNQTVIQPLRVALPTANSSCDYMSSSTSMPTSSMPVQNNMNQPVLNIKDLEYPTEIFPDRNDENPMDEVSSINDVTDNAGGCLIDPLTSDNGLMEERPPPMLNLPPPLQPIVIQSGKSETSNKQ